MQTYRQPRILQYLIEYIHLNPFGIEEPDLLKEARRELRDEAVAFSKNYRYSSFMDYLGVKRPENAILCQDNISHSVKMTS